MFGQKSYMYVLLYLSPLHFSLHLAGGVNSLLVLCGTQVTSNVLLTPSLSSQAYLPTTLKPMQNWTRTWKSYTPTLQVERTVQLEGPLLNRT